MATAHAGTLTLVTGGHEEAFMVPRMHAAAYRVRSEPLHAPAAIRIGLSLIVVTSVRNSTRTLAAAGQPIVLQFCNSHRS